MTSPGTPGISEPVTVTVPLVVVGGGLAGTAAAIAAARAGTKTWLIQERPVLGGNSSSEIRVNPVGAAGSGYRRDARETGIMEEIFLESRATSYGLRQINGRHYPMWDVVLSNLTGAEPNLTVMLNTRVISIETAETSDGGYERRITRLHAVQQGTEAVFVITPDMVIDATGDGFIAVQAGAPFRYGRESRDDFGEPMAIEVADDVVLGSTIMFAARDVGRPVPYTPPSWAHVFADEEALPFRSHEQLDSGYWWIEWGGRTNTITNNEEIRKELHAAVFGVWDHIKNRCTVPDVRERAANWTLDWIGHLPGKRESRRFEGDHIITQHDILDGLSNVPFDSVAYGGWPIDLHAPDGVYSSEKPCTQPQPPTVFGIPLRALYSRTVSNLFLAGRNISQTHVAHGSTRVMKTTAVIGQGAGTAASFAIAAGLTPRELVASSDRLHAVQQHLLRAGAYLPAFTNDDEDDLTRQSGVTVTASSEAALVVELDPAALPRWEQYGLSTTEADAAKFHARHVVPAATLDQRHVQSITISGDRIAALSLRLINESSEPVPATLEIRQAKHLRDFGPAGPDDAALARIETTVGPGEADIAFPLETPLMVTPGLPVIVSLAAEPRLSWVRTLQEPTGTQAGCWDKDWGWWRMLRGTLAFDLEPVSAPYGPQNILDGANRPEIGPSLWISDPALPLPQSIAVQWPGVQEIGSVELTFDSQLSGWIWEGAFPSIVRDYTIEVCDPASGEWTSVATITGNYHRRRVQTFPQARTDQLRITVTATNGGSTARIVELRAYAGGTGGN